MVKGVATFVPSWAPYGGPKPTIVVDQAALDNAGTGGVWNLPHQWQAGTADDRADDARHRPRRRPGSPGSAATPPAPWPPTTSGSARPAGTAPSAPGPGPRPGRARRSTDTPLGLRAGYDYCVSVRARNRAGQLSGWTGQRCLARALDDRGSDPSPRAGSARAPRRSSTAPYVTTTSKGATLVRTGAKVKRVGLVATTCRTCGKVAVLVDGKRIGTVNLAGANAPPAGADAARCSRAARTRSPCGCAPAGHGPHRRRWCSAAADRPRGDASAGRRSRQAKREHRAGCYRTSGVLLETRRHRSARDHGVAPLVELEHLGQQLGTQAVPGARGAVDPQLETRAHRPPPSEGHRKDRTGVGTPCSYPRQVRLNLGVEDLQRAAYEPAPCRPGAGTRRGASPARPIGRGRRRSRRVRLGREPAPREPRRSGAAR